MQISPCPKKKRIENKDLIEFLRTQPCIICGGQSEAHHVTTMGSGGDDTPDNLICVCRIHHSEWHQYATSHMITVYPIIKKWLRAMKRTDLINEIEDVLTNNC